VTAIVKQERLRVTPQRLARITGWLTLALACLGVLRPLTLQALVIPGDAVTNKLVAC